MWTPASVEELERATRSGRLVEKKRFEAKREVGRNKDVAIDVNAMALDGGAVVYGIAEDANGRPTIPSPIELAGQRERIDQVVHSSCAEPPEIDIHDLPLAADPSRGYLFVEVPASPHAPQQVTTGGAKDPITRFMSEPVVQPRQDPTPKPGFYVLKTDGGITAEQGAAGPAAIGVVLKDHKYRDVDEVSQPIGWARNHHEAEYKALIAGLELARRHGIDRIRVFSDSALVVNTVNGDWNLQPEHLKDLCAKAGLLVKEFADIQLSWVPREMNLEADALASRALGRGR